MSNGKGFKTSAAFDKTFEIANILNREPAGSTRYVLPSEVKFEWDNEAVKRIDAGFAELRALLKFDPSGDQYESAEVIQNWADDGRKEAQALSPGALADRLYGDLFYYSDRWCHGRMARILSIWTVIHEKVQDGQ